MKKKKERTVHFPNLQSEIAKRGMTIQDLGDMLGLQGPAISKRLNRITPWKLPELEIMSREFKESIDKLVS